MTKEDGKFEWSFHAAKIARMVRGFQPFPTTYTFFEGKKLTLWDALPLPEREENAAGTVISSSGNALVVACGSDSSLAINELQLEGKKRMAAQDFLNGVKLRPGDILA